MNLRKAAFGFLQTKNVALIAVVVLQASFLSLVTSCTKRTFGDSNKGESGIYAVVSRGAGFPNPTLAEPDLDLSTIRLPEHLIHVDMV